jgi:hypothetical protein
MLIPLADFSTKDPYSQWTMVALAIISIYFAVVRPMMKKKKDPLAKPAQFGLSKERTVERQMQNLLVELSEMTRQITAQLDTRSQKLQLLIEEADKRIAELQHAPQQPGSPRNEPVWSAPASQPTLPAEPVDEEHQRIYDLADGGKTAGDIAKVLGQPRGEVELILALRPRAGV